LTDVAPPYQRQDLPLGFQPLWHLFHRRLLRFYALIPTSLYPPPNLLQYPLRRTQANRAADRSASARPPPPPSPCERPHGPIPRPCPLPEHLSYLHPPHPLHPVLPQPPLHRIHAQHQIHPLVPQFYTPSHLLSPSPPHPSYTNSGQRVSECRRVELCVAAAPPSGGHAHLLLNIKKAFDLEWYKVTRRAPKGHGIRVSDPPSPRPSPPLGRGERV
jgi:hypothetical protein